MTVSLLARPYQAVPSAIAHFSWSHLNAVSLAARDSTSSRSKPESMPSFDSRDSQDTGLPSAVSRLVSSLQMSGLILTSRNWVERGWVYSWHGCPSDG